ncbi:SDR family oxidoreductase [Microbacterium sp. X-17]|uniref:SDR family oxidoreductase n=1 Tax=Microbacterium sp. X-17 TaxID=3144404 RepID=UPI0031F4B895
MKVFVTGASGFIGSAVISELLRAGHDVAGLARSDRSALDIEALGATPIRGSLDHPEQLAEQASDSGGVIHLAYQNSSGAEAAAATDRRAIETLGEALAGSDRPLVIAGGTLTLPSGKLGSEKDRPDPEGAASFRGANEAVALGLAERRVRVSLVRLAPCVHDRARRGFVGALIDAAERTGVSGYVGDGAQRWPAVHRKDAAALFRTSLESAPGGTVVHGVGETGVRLRDIAELIGDRLDVPVESISAESAVEHFGWIGALVGLDAPASNDLTMNLLQWEPWHIRLLDDMASGDFFAGVS